jgi:predicted phage terminase large subunit-like protein
VGSISVKQSNYDWNIVYEEERKEDGSLFFPERLSDEFLSNKRKILGSYIYANQYQNRVIPDEDQDFKKDWLKYYHFIPEDTHTFITIDPAISLQEGADYTAFCVVHVNRHTDWFVSRIERMKITATDTVKLIFNLYEQYNPQVIGIEAIAYQESLMHFLNEEMKRKGVMLPLKAIKASSLDADGNKKVMRSKNMRILSLVPRFENGKIFLCQGMHDFEVEFSSFPRGSHDDCMDALARIEDIVYYPHQPRRINNGPNPQDPEYERWYIQQLSKKRS